MKRKYELWLSEGTTTVRLTNRNIGADRICWTTPYVSDRRIGRLVDPELFLAGNY
jgi:hypothetical protein